MPFRTLKADAHWACRAQPFLLRREQRVRIADWRLDIEILELFDHATVVNLQRERSHHPGGRVCEVDDLRRLARRRSVELTASKPKLSSRLVAQHLAAAPLCVRQWRMPKAFLEHVWAFVRGWPRSSIVPHVPVRRLNLNGGERVLCRRIAPKEHTR